jgi:hypothetical protein
MQRRPTDANMARELAWAYIEIHHYGDALQSVVGYTHERQAKPENAIVQAVAHWQAQEHDEALRDFNLGVRTQPEWQNPKWVKALYSPLVARSLQEMQSERERQQQKAKLAASGNEIPR